MALCRGNRPLVHRDGRRGLEVLRNHFRFLALHCLTPNSGISQYGLVDFSRSSFLFSQAHSAVRVRSLKALAKSHLSNYQSSVMIENRKATKIENAAKTVFR